MKKKTIYILLGIIILLSCLSFGYYNGILNGYEKTFSDVPPAEPDKEYSLLLSENSVDEETGCDEEYDEDEYFENKEDSIAYLKYLSETAQYKSTGTLSFLWNATPTQTTDSINAAIGYFKENLAAYVFNFPKEILPDYTYYKEFVGSTGETGQDSWIVPTTIRKFTVKELKLGSSQYKTLIEFLSKGRESIDYFELYSTYKLLIHKLLPKERYDKFEYPVIVKRLIAAHQDFENDDELYSGVENIMNMEWEAHVDEMKKLPSGIGSSIWHEDFYYYFEEILPDSSIKVFADEEGKVDKSSLAWTYSFWLRRHNEGNTDNVIKTLRSIQRDYN
jgi:hypothetical protein